MFVIHYLPLEHYPPVINFLNYWEKQVFCFTTKSSKYSTFDIQRHRFFRSNEISGGRNTRLLKYILFTVKCVFQLILKKPKEVVYYETISALPALIYKSIFNRSVKLCVHYHEYTSPEEYEKGMLISRILHRIEKKKYNRYFWISHTNKKRKELFCHDTGVLSEMVEVLPNYPSKEWARENVKYQSGEVLKIVFVGYSVSYESNYTKELIQWLSKSSIKTEFDVYCLDQNSIQQEQLGVIGNTKVTLKDVVAYENLGEVLKNYHVGVILYKGLIPNYVHNAPNKLFEYLSCGLDVWYPSEMDGVKEYQRETSPKVVELDFKSLDKTRLETLIVPKESCSKQFNDSFFAEDIYQRFQNKLKV